MAGRGWTRSIFLAALGATGAAAAQLGIGYGLGIIAWLSPDTGDAATSGAWSASLAWTTFISATSVVVGASVAHRAGAAASAGRVHRAAWRLGLALAASLGALLALPLLAVPASRIQIEDNFAPHLLAAIYAVIGVVAGLVVALFALTARAIAANVMATAAWLWILAIVAVSGGIAAGRTEYAQLGVWKFTNAGPVWQQFYVPGALILLGGGLLVGGLAAYPGAARGDRRFGVAISGVAGPAVVVVAYVAASPAPGNAPFEAVSALRTVPFMALAGLIGSALVAAVGGISPPPERRNQAGPVPPPPPPAPPARSTPPTLPAPSAGQHDTTAYLTPVKPAAWPSHAQPPRSGPLPSPSPNAVSAKASVPPSARIDPRQA